jgi:hypothetical protein
MTDYSDGGYDEVDPLHGAGCCCGCCGEAAPSTGDGDVAYVDEPFAQEIDVEPVYVEPVYVEPSPVALGDPTVVQQPYIEPALPLQPAVEAGQAVVDPAAAIIGGASVVGGSDPYAGAPIELGTTMGFVGGSEPLGMTITPGSSGIDLNAALAGGAVIGGPTPMSAASADVAAYAAQLAQLTPEQLLAAEGYGQGPRIPLTGGTPEEIGIRTNLTLQGLQQLGEAERRLAITSNINYDPDGWDDPNSPSYLGNA